MRYALKEWNATVEALGRGHVVAIWRKGGIGDSPNVREANESFRVDHKQFVLFPTFAHQDFEKVKKDFWPLLNQKSVLNKDNQVKIKYWAEVEEEIELENTGKLLSISTELVNSEEYLRSSWNLYPEHKGKVLLLRVYSLSNPVLVPNSPEYAGCRSWIELKISIPKIGSKPILSFKDFSHKVRLVKALLEDAHHEVSHGSEVVASV